MKMSNVCWEGVKLMIRIENSAGLCKKPDISGIPAFVAQLTDRSVKDRMNKFWLGLAEGDQHKFSEVKAGMGYLKT